MESINIGYIGLDHLHRDPFFQLFGIVDAELTAVCEPNEAFDPDSVKTMSERPDDLDTEGLDIASLLSDTPVYRDPFKLIEQTDVDLVWLTLPNRDTPAVTEAAIEKGVHVMSEKPMARTADELAPIAEKAAARDVKVGVSYFNRGHPVVQDLRKRATEGFFGDVLTIDSRFLASKLTHRDTSNFVYDDAASRGGALQWLGVHWIDLIMWILDDPITRVNARSTTVTETVDVEEGMTLQFETRTGAIGTFQTGYYLGVAAKDTKLDIYGSDGRALTAAWRGDPVKLDLQSYGEEWQAAPERSGTYDLAYDKFPAWGNLALDFFEGCFDAFANGGALPANIDDAVRVLRVLDAAYESAATEAWIETGL